MSPLSALAPTPTASLRRLPPPELEPPYDDDAGPQALTGGPGAVQGALALVLPAVPSSLLPTRARGLRLVPPLDGSTDDRFGARPTPRSELPAPGPWSGRLVQALLEVLAGTRPVQQLLRWTSQSVYADLEDAVTPSTGRKPVRAGSRPGAATVRSVHVSEPAEGIAEVCAVVARTGRTRAVALRREGVDGRWQCTALTVG